MNKDNREREEWQKFLERKAARKAGNTAALSGKFVVYYLVFQTQGVML
jgi:hypothetical protein